MSDMPVMILIMGALGHHVLCYIQGDRLEGETDISADADDLFISACFLHWRHLIEKRIILLPSFLYHMLIVTINRMAVATHP